MRRETVCGFVLFVSSFSVLAHSQSSEWTWVGGNQAKSTTVATSFGTLGVPSSSNFPGPQSGATTWTDASGNLWLFGGVQSDSSGNSGAGNELWRYNPSTSQWTWMGGGPIDPTAAAAAGSYGTLGVAAASNLPPGRRASGASWVDASGNLWLFGGLYGAEVSGSFVTGYYNDLWKYDPTANQWTWMGGSNTPSIVGTASGVFGTQGTPSTANIPSGRFGSVSWTDQNGNLWLMGGSGVDASGALATLNDLWRYNPTYGEWTWMTGSSLVGAGVYGADGVYGSQGVASAGNTPGSRYQGESWIDASGDLWLFGGSGTDSVGSSGLLNDLWEYSTAANTWTWMGGGDTLPTVKTSGIYQATAGVYGTLGAASATNAPGGRFEGAAWADASGDLWLFGGVGADSTDTDGNLNDVWVYSPASNQWTWMGGSNTVNATAVYGTEGVADPSNTPGSRDSMLYWTDATHNLWLFGGQGGGYTDGDPNAFNYVDLWTAATVGATAPAVTLSPTFFNFPATLFNTTSAAMSTTLTNTGGAALTGIAPSIGGLNPNSFAISANTCGNSLAAGASCTISVVFTPAQVSNYNATLSIADNAAGSPQTVLLNGDGSSVASCANNPATPYVNCNPGGAVIGSNSQSQQLTFAAPVVTTATASAFSTEIVGTYNGTTVYDQTFAAAYGTPAVQAGVTAANAAVAAAGGPGVVIPAPALTSSSTNTSTASTSIYSVAQPESSTTIVTSTTTTTFGPATIMAQVASYGNPANPTAGETSVCNLTNLPSATMPTCAATNAGTLTILGGQEDINTNINNNYLIDTATTNTTTTTTNAVYSITATSSVTLVTPSVAVTPAATSISTAQSLSVPVAVSSATTKGTGTVVLSGGGYTSSAATLVNGAATFTIPAGALATGTDTLTANYTPDANSSSIFTSASGSAMVSVTQAVTAPVASLTPPGPLSFTAASGATSATQTVTLANSGNAALNIAGISITGTNAGNFNQTSTCGTSLAAGSNCTITLSFTPTSTASFTANLTVSDNAAGSPQTVVLNGAGTAAPSFTIGALTQTGTASPGSSANYQLTITPVNGPFSSPVSFTASGVPSGYIATFSPAAVTPGNSPATATLTITKSPTVLLRIGFPWAAGPALACLPFLVFGFRRRRRALTWLVLALALVASLAFSGCGGGFSLPSSTGNVTITATGGGVTQTTSVTLTVQQ